MVDLPSNDPIERLFDRRAVQVFGPLHAEAIARLCAQLMALDGLSTDDVEITVSSPGGPIDDIGAVLDVIGLMRAKVNVTCTGTAGGTAAVLVACATGRRRAGPNARLSLRVHEEELTAGSSAEVARRVDEMVSRREHLASTVARATRQSAAAVTRELEQGGWFDAASARAWGLLDDVVAHRAER